MADVPGELNELVTHFPRWPGWHHLRYLETNPHASNTYTQPLGLASQKLPISILPWATFNQTEVISNPAICWVYNIAFRLEVLNCLGTSTTEIENCGTLFSAYRSKNSLMISVWLASPYKARMHRSILWSFWFDFDQELWIDIMSTHKKVDQIQLHRKASWIVACCSKLLLGWMPTHSK